ncbi:hypothetical protein AB6A40_000291 [Gnathostoma spinigerum]|uniref:Uncharacterized protein n=1 Tax=Gnathostoma spinigerum TaxID=75299 RepID=A0ABD6EAT9_9BILA
MECSRIRLKTNL